MKLCALVSLGILSIAPALLFESAAEAHDIWNNGAAVPEWVKRLCCGEIEAHNLRNSEVKMTPNGYVINGWPEIIPYEKALPSPDGSYWAFYENVDDGDAMHCFFAPMGSS
jgi:hypothetical protein